MSYHVNPFGTEAEVWQLLEGGGMAIRTAIFTYPEDAQLFADTMNGLRREEEAPELGPDEFVLINEDGTLDESEYSALWDEDGHSDDMAHLLQLSDEAFEAFLTGSDLDDVDFDPDYSPLHAPLYGDSL